MNIELSLHDRNLTLYRYPVRTNETLQAWDAGDEYLINHVEELDLAPNQNILIINDHFGALSCWFSNIHNVTLMSDSFLAHTGTNENLQRNHCRPIHYITCMDAIPDSIDLVLLQLPKSNRHLTWILSQLRQQLPSHVPVIAVNKAKEIHTSTLKLFEKYLGETKTSLAWKKHRLVFSQANSRTSLPVSPITEWKVDGEDIRLSNLPNVYSGESLDLGARFILPHLPSTDKQLKIIDLGCGNGVLSVKLAQHNPNAHITSVDESFMAVQSAQKNMLDNLGQAQQHQCVANNCLDGFEENSTDLVVCNPPFHQQQAITDHIAWQMFCDAKHVLAKGGQLIVIGNRHLGYDGKLSRLFGKSQVSTVASNKKFVILQATK
ncbi:methyltransferase [Vibrio paucivorans]|uniref:Ribosomal RNA large subunit methyltransferase G n=1 Tax=Vibrio paucivorans TaxID=2829489 RepID=A0A9X3HTZ6_9VIBR|nr:class I SAM-dependent methyltransferase [Vibrio paucivorans]MCW8336325.1 class I SAM-dependent methyltransferase [Vibrio paucivorans]